MSTKRTCDLPARLENLRQRFERWRRTRKVRSRIPEPLWAAAVKSAAKYGIHRTAKALRVDYYALKKRVEQKTVVAGLDPVGHRQRPGQAHPPFPFFPFAVSRFLLSTVASLPLLA